MITTNAENGLILLRGKYDGAEQKNCSAIPTTPGKHRCLMMEALESG